MHMVVVGGGPTGVEYAGELHDFLIVGLLIHCLSAQLTILIGRPEEVVPRDRRPSKDHAHRGSSQRPTRLF